MEIRHPIDTRMPAMFRSGNLLRGVFNTIPHPALVEMCAYAGFDFVIIDNEHGSADLETTENMIRAARASGIVPIVRCFEQDIARVLDAGAGAVQIPMVRDAAHAKELVARVRYPSVGKRGSAFNTRASGYGAFGGPDHTKLSNEGIALIVMIETPEAVDQAHEIAAVEGVNAVFVGPNDLAHAMGHENRSKDPEVQAAMEKAIRAVVAAGKCAGTIALTPDDEKKYSAWGARYFASVTTSIITQAFKTAASSDREMKATLSY